MDRSDAAYLAFLNGIWLIMLLEHIVLKLELALPFAIVWGIGTLLANIRILRCYICRITYED